jgi:hypothetical protein
MTLLGKVIIGAVVCFLILTIAYQFRRLGDALSRYDVLRLLPRWTFFAPNPAMRDIHVVSRDRFADGSTSPWGSVIFAPPRAALDFIWHPGKRPRKVVSDAAQSVKMIQYESGADGIQYSLPYLVILSHCLSQHPRLDGASARQFAIVETTGREDRRLWIAFTSHYHPF